MASRCSRTGSQQVPRICRNVTGKGQRSRSERTDHRNVSILSPECQSLV